MRIVIKLFNQLSGIETETFDWNGDGVYHEPPKYHELPIAMQVGIFMEYCTEHPNNNSGISMQNYVTMISEFFTGELFKK